MVPPLTTTHGPTTNYHSLDIIEEFLPQDEIFPHSTTNNPHIHVPEALVIQPDTAVLVSFVQVILNSSEAIGVRFDSLLAS